VNDQDQVILADSSILTEQDVEWLLSIKGTMFALGLNYHKSHKIQKEYGE
jgi:hypothetical protein